MPQDPWAAIEVKIEMVLNRCNGRYGLSAAAAREVLRRKGLEAEDGPYGSVFVAGTKHSVMEFVLRTDPDLIAVVREMGAAANDIGADLQLVSVPVKLLVDHYDGKETVKAVGGSAP